MKPFPFHLRCRVPRTRQVLRRREPEDADKIYPDHRQVLREVNLFVLAVFERVLKTPTPCCVPPTTVDPDDPEARNANVRHDDARVRLLPRC